MDKRSKQTLHTLNKYFYSNFLLSSESKTNQSYPSKIRTKLNASYIYRGERLREHAPTRNSSYHELALFSSWQASPSHCQLPAKFAGSTSFSTPLQQLILFFCSLPPQFGLLTHLKQKEITAMLWKEIHSSTSAEATTMALLILRVHTETAALTFLRVHEAPAITSVVLGRDVSLCAVSNVPLRTQNEGKLIDFNPPQLS